MIKPSYTKTLSPLHPEVLAMKKVLSSYNLHTVCEEARCPNKGECFRAKTATFMILGNFCTRRCGFCAIKTGKTLPPDPSEPQRIAQTVVSLKLRYVVITSVTRDDLPDGGAEQFCKTVESIKALSPETKIEVLTPDFRHKPGALEKILMSPIFCFSHNIETVPRLYKKVRKGANYHFSLSLLKRASELHPKIWIKSGMMVGHGETEEEIYEVLKDLKAAHVQIVTLGQYLQPHHDSLPVVEYKPLPFFQKMEKWGKELGFAYFFSGPLVRSSYRAWEQVCQAG